MPIVITDSIFYHNDPSRTKEQKAERKAKALADLITFIPGRFIVG